MLPPDAAASTTGPRPLSAAASSAAVPAHAAAATAGQRPGKAAATAGAAAASLVAKPVIEDASDGQPPPAAPGDHEGAVDELNGAARETDDMQPPPPDASGATAGGQATASEPPQPDASKPEGDEAAGHGKGAASADAEAHAESQHSGEVQRGNSCSPPASLRAQAHNGRLLSSTMSVQTSAVPGPQACIRTDPNLFPSDVRLVARSQCPGC